MPKPQEETPSGLSMALKADPHLNPGPFFIGRLKQYLPLCFRLTKKTHREKMKLLFVLTQKLHEMHLIIPIFIYFFHMYIFIHTFVLHQNVRSL